MAKIRMFWDNCIVCKKRLVGAKEKSSGYCKKCQLERELGSLTSECQ